jgi:carbonic anhydrase
MSVKQYLLNFIGGSLLLASASAFATDLRTLTAESERKPLPTVTQRLTPNAALKRLMEGNMRFTHDKLVCADRTSDRRTATAAQQRPFAVILGCADSRIPPEIVFDQGVGDLFVIRVAGNVVGPLELDSVEYSVIHNDSSLVIVLGHENCGAVTAVMANQTQDIEAIASLIEPAIQTAKGRPGNPLENAIKANVRAVVKQLRNSPVLAKYIEDRKIKVVGGYYNLVSGQVELLKDH